MKLRRILPRIFRYIIKKSLRLNQKFFINIAIRIPFSRFHKVTSRLFWGEEVINWRGCVIKVNPGEIFGYYPYFLEMHSDEQIEKLIELCRDSRILFDVGANIGLISFAVASSCPQLEVFSFEPDYNSAARFRDNLQLNPDMTTRIHLIQKAVAEVNYNLPFRPSNNPENIDIGRLASDILPFPEDYLVNTIRLDTFCDGIKRYPQIIKIDVEGAELRVIRGMQGLFIKEAPKAIIIEIHVPSDTKQAIEFKKETKIILEQHGYILFYFGSKKWRKLGAVEEWPRQFHMLAFNQK